MIRHAYRSALALALLVALVPAAFAKKPRQPVNLEAEVDAILSTAFPADQPGAVALVVKDGKVVYRKAFGMANLELGVPMRPEMVFEVGSVTKQFTAVAILMLAEQGKLSLSDRISKYFPDSPYKDAKITIEHLLTHTSGIPSYTNSPNWGPAVWRKDMTPQEILDITKGAPLDFAPGTKWAYNNTGYVMLGVVIEKASGTSYAEFVQKNIFDKLGMTGALYGSHETVVPNRATGYSRAGDAFANAPYLSMTQPYAAGSLMMSADDLAIWNAAISSGKLISKASWQKAFTPYRLVNGESTRYGYGWQVEEFDEHPIVRHGGGIPGYISETIRMPEDDVYVVLLTNVTPPLSDPEFISTKIAAAAVGKPYRDPAAIRLDERLLDDYVGVYRIAANATRVVTRDGSKIYTQRSGGAKLEAFAVRPTEFFYKDSFTRFRFERDAKGKVTRMVYTFPDGREEIAIRTDTPVPAEPDVVAVDPKVLAAYAGEYELSPGLVIAVTVEDGRLYGQATGQAKVELFATSETDYFLKVVDARITFVRNGAGAVEKLVLHQGNRTLEGPKVK